jgi:hypothetical protein
MSPHYEPIEPQFDLAAQEAKAARKPEGDRSPYEGEDSAEQAAGRAELAEKARELERLADEIEKEALEAEKAAAQNVGDGVEVPTFGALAEVPEVPGKVDQDPEIQQPQDPQVP